MNYPLKEEDSLFFGERMKFKKVKLISEKEIEIQLNPVSISQYKKILINSDNGLSHSKLNSDNPVTNISFQDAVAYCNFRSLEDNFQPAYDQSENPVIPKIIEGDGYRLFTFNEWKELIALQMEDKLTEINGLKGYIWQWTETKELHNFKPDGQKDSEHPTDQWTYRVLVGGSSKATREFLKGYPVAIMPGNDSLPIVGFRLVRGERKDN